MVGAVLSDEQVEAVFSDLDRVRAGLVEGADEESDWRVTVLGGAWTAMHRGQAFDAFRAAPRTNSSAEAWAVSYGMGRSVRIDVSLYGAGPANDMARAFALKCQFFFDLWEGKGAEHYEFTEEDLASYAEPPWFAALEFVLHGRALARFQWLPDLQPKRV